MKKNIVSYLVSLLLILFIVSCSTEAPENNISVNGTVKKDIYTEKVDLQELIDKIGTKDHELIDLIINNPISKLKNKELQKSSLEASTIFFDTNHIQAIKNDKDLEVYIIPVYYNNVRDANLYSLTINIDENAIDTKLTVLEVQNDGSTQYSTRKFKNSIKKSLTSREIEMEIACSCTVSISDCTCCTTHASGGCDHPNIIISCSSCSGTGSYSGVNYNDTSTSSQTTPNTPNTTIATVSSSNGNYSYNYTQTGSQIYVALYKKFIPNNDFSALQRYNIVNNPEISGALLNFLEAEGNSESNKNFVLSVINAVEEGTVSDYQDVSVLINAYKKAQEFLAFKNDYLATHPTVTLEQFENWFGGVSEGQDGDYDAAYWEDPNLTFQQQPLPSYNDFVNSFPRDGLGQLLKGADVVYNYIGGEVGQKRFSDPAHTENTCALKVSRALNYSGVTIPDVPGTFKGADGKNYFLNSKALNLWMRKTFGIPTGSNHITGPEAGNNGINLPYLLNGKKGIYSLVSSNTDWAYGHVDFLMPNATCGVYCHFYDAPIDYIDIWILN